MFLFGDKFHSSNQTEMDQAGPRQYHGFKKVLKISCSLRAGETDPGTLLVSWLKACGMVLVEPGRADLSTFPFNLVKVIFHCRWSEILILTGTELDRATQQDGSRKPAKF